MRTSPVEWVVLQFGGQRALARAIGYDPGTICRCHKAKRFATVQMVERILLVAAEQGLDVRPSDLVFGRETEGETVMDSIIQKVTVPTRP